MEFTGMKYKKRQGRMQWLTLELHRVLLLQPHSLVGCPQLILTLRISETLEDD
jgi:hypothetical protein